MSGKSIELAVVIMAGGAGTRFWPLSTEQRPKQFLRLFGERTLLQQSYDRIAPLVPPERVLVLTSEAHVPLVREQLPGLGPDNIIGEPMRRDTAAAVALAAMLCRRRFGNPVMLVLTSDHLIEPAESFRGHILSAAAEAARESVLYTMGIRPTYPATCYGYLEAGDKVAEDGGMEHLELLHFVEKPDEPTAVQYLEAGNYYWNSGMFVWSTGTILGELDRQLPRHTASLAPAVEHDRTPGWKEALRKAFGPLKATSIDYGVMEGARAARMIPAGFEWSDVGGWLALEEYLDQDGRGNALRGRLETLDASGNLVYCEDEQETVALVGVSGLVVVRAGNRTLVVPREQAERIKELVGKLKR